MGRRLQEVLRQHGAEVHGCYARALGDEPGLRGELLVRLFVAPGGQVNRAEILKDQTGSRRLGECLTSAMRGWKASSLASRDEAQLVFPLVFKPDALDSASAPTTGEAGAGGASTPRYVVPLAEGRPGPIGAGKVVARVLLDAVTIGPTQASLTVLTLQPTARLALHAHPGALELLYVEKGMARVRTGGGALEVANAGDVIVVPAGAAHSLESAPLAPLHLLQIFAPGGPERAYRDPRDRAGTVPAPRMPRGRTSPADSGDPSAVRVVHAADVHAHPILGGKGEALLFLDGLPVTSASLQRFEAAEGAKVPVHTHEGADELLYVISGRGEMTVGTAVIPVGPNDAIHLPAGTSHALVVSEKMTAVQCYAPAGPEQRFKGTGPPGKPTP